MSTIVKVTVSETIYEIGTVVGSIYLSVDIIDVSKVEELKKDMEAFAGILKKHYLGKKINQNDSEIS